ncbi:MAG: S1C family serine protease [Gemmataceae bacterium]|nr:S1C family serine protease [Gemmataceae bacterium]
MKIRATIALVFLAAAAPAQDRYATIAQATNARMVKVFGSGGFRGVVAYGTGIVVSPDGYVLTAAGSLLDTPELRVHLPDGRRCSAKLVVIEPALDAALIKVEMVEDLPFFDVAAAAARPLALPGTWILGFTNCFEIATRDEAMSVQRGVIQAYTRLPLQRGIFEAPYTGEVYVLDAVTNNPGAAGGALVSRSGTLLGLIGKELRNAAADTWVNYAVPVQARIEVRDGEAKRIVSLAEFVSLGMRGQYKPTAKPEKSAGDGGYHGIVLVPNVVERTPPYVEETVPGSPAAAAGLRPDDLIVYVDGEPVISVAAFRAIMSRTHAGQVIKLEVRRGDRLEPVELKLGERKPQK